MRRAAVLTISLTLAIPAQAQVLNYEDVFQSPTLTGTWNGERTKLEEKGIQLGGDEILEALGNPQGGLQQGGRVEGRFELFANIDLEKALGWHGALFHANAYQIHGQGLSSHNLGNLVSVSNIEARPATQLFSLWLQKSLFDDTLSLRAGQIAADDEFFVSQYAPLFINSTFGWPAIMGINLPSGGPAYPMARLGLRARVALSPRLTLAAAVFNGDSKADPSGLDVHINGDPFAISELAYSMTMFEMPGSMKLGAWFHGGRFNDQRFDGARVSLADPASSGMAGLHRGDDGGYFILDQLLWRNGGSDAGLGGFFRIGGAPNDRNLVELHMDGGLTLAAPFGRANDTVGIGLSYEQIGASQKDLARDYRRLTGTSMPAPDFESALEISYQAQVASWWIVQPDVQWIIHPGGRVLDLSNPPARENAMVLGLRTAVAL